MICLLKQSDLSLEKIVTILAADARAGPLRMWSFAFTTRSPHCGALRFEDLAAQSGRSPSQRRRTEAVALQQAGYHCEAQPK
jgi:hypothetical protein